MICTPRHAKIILIHLVSIILTFSLYKIWTAGIENDSTFLIQPDYKHINNCRRISHPILVKISTTFQMILPPIFCLILNILIFKIIKKSPHTKFYPTERCKKINQTTYTVISLSVIFIILISPMGMLIIHDQFVKHYNTDAESIKKILKNLIARKYALMLYETNMIINFPIYILTIKNFRYVIFIYQIL